MVIEFYEPPMCCSSGCCGPSVDEKLVELNRNIESLRKKYPGIMIYRYMISQQPNVFRANNQVYRTLQDKGRKALPITTINGNIIKTHKYPSLREIEEKING